MPTKYKKHDNKRISLQERSNKRRDRCFGMYYSIGTKFTLLNNIKIAIELENREEWLLDFFKYLFR